MNNPYDEIFNKVIELSKKLGYSTFDYQPDNEQGYPFVFVGNQQNIDIQTKTRMLGITHIQIDVYTEHQFRSEVSSIMDSLTKALYECHSTDHFSIELTDSENRMMADTTTEIPLWHGILELDIKYY